MKSEYDYIKSAKYSEQYENPNQTLMLKSEQ